MLKRKKLMNSFRNVKFFLEFTKSSEYGTAVFVRGKLKTIDCVENGHLPA